MRFTLIDVGASVDADSVAFISGVACAVSVAKNVGAKRVVGMTSAVEDVAFVKIDAAPFAEAVAQKAWFAGAVPRSIDV